MTDLHNSSLSKSANLKLLKSVLSNMCLRKPINLPFVRVDKLGTTNLKTSKNSYTNSTCIVCNCSSVSSTLEQVQWTTLIENNIIENSSEKDKVSSTICTICSTSVNTLIQVKDVMEKIIVTMKKIVQVGRKEEPIKLVLPLNIFDEPDVLGNDQLFIKQEDYSVCGDDGDILNGCSSPHQANITDEIDIHYDSPVKIKFEVDDEDNSSGNWTKLTNGTQSLTDDDDINSKFFKTEPVSDEEDEWVGSDDLSSSDNEEDSDFAQELPESDPDSDEEQDLGLKSKTTLSLPSSTKLLPSTTNKKRNRYTPDNPHKKKPYTNYVVTSSQPKCEKPFSCKMCSKSFRLKQACRIHIEYHHFKIVNLTCPNCSKGFYRADTFAKHQRACSSGKLDKRHRSAAMKNPDDGLYHCTECPRKFSRCSGLDKHFGQVHTKEKKYSCRNCSKSFYRLDSHKRHQTACLEGRLDNRIKCQALRNEKDGLLHCTKCSFSVKKSSEYYAHFNNIHLKIVRHKCALCGKGFYKSRARNVHQEYCEKQMKGKKKRKMEGKLLPCEQCDKEFSYKEGLRAHVRSVHLGIERFSCEFCPRGFYKRAHWENHQRSCERIAKLRGDGEEEVAPVLIKFDEIEVSSEGVLEDNPPELEME